MNRRILLVAVALASLSGCLCVRAYDNFHYFQCRARQSEARSGLKALAVAEQAFFAEQGRYGSLDEVGFAPPATGERPPVYRYSLLEVDAEHFVAEARGMVALHEVEREDVWVVDARGEPANTTPACARPGEEPTPSSDAAGE